MKHLLSAISLFICYVLSLAQIETSSLISIDERETETLKIVFQMKNVLPANKYIYCKSIAFTAEENTDFAAVHHIVTIPKGKLKGSLEIPLVKDNDCEGSESFYINWSEDLVEDPDFDHVTRYWKPLAHKEGERKHTFEVHKVGIYGGDEDDENKVIEVDRESQGYQGIEVVKGVRHRVSFLASRRVGTQPADSTIDLHIKVVDPKTKEIEASRHIERSNTEFKFTEESFYFTPTTDKVELVFSTDNNMNNRGMILDKLSIVPIFNDEKKAEDILSSDLRCLVEHNLSHGMIKVNIDDCEEVKSKPDLQTLNLYFDNNDFHIIHGNTSLAKQNKDIAAQAVMLLNKYKDININIRAYADCRGTQEYNKALSLKRAKETKHYLIENGINKERISKLTALGETKASTTSDCDCSKNCTSEKLAKDRKVEIHFDTF